MARDDFTAPTKTQLAKRVGSLCSNPSCRAPTSGPTKGESDRSVNVGVAAHICAASKNGPRFDPAMASSERMAIGNGIWLCAGCAKKIDDDPAHYTVTMLRRWKREAEEEAHRAVGRPAPPAASTPSPGSASTSAPPARGAIAFPVLPHFTSLHNDQREIVVPRDFSLWVTPSEHLELNAGMARASVAAGAGAPGWCSLPFSNGEDVSDRGASHPELGTWVGLWRIDCDTQYRNCRQVRSLGISDRGVLAWQHEEARFNGGVDVVRFGEVVGDIAAFVGFALRTYRSLDLEPHVNLRLRLSIDTPRPSAETVIEGLPFFGHATPRPVSLKVTSARLSARAGFDPEEGEVVRLTHKLVNQVLGSCKAVPAAYGVRTPSVVALEEATIQEFLEGRAS